MFDVVLVPPYPQVGKVKLSNKNTRKFIKNINVLVNMIFDKDEVETQLDR
jgi:hypothetical protein